MRDSLVDAKTQNGRRIFPSSVAATEKRQVEHLQRWFAIGVQYPWLEPVIRQLIKLPHNRVVDAIYWWIHKLHKGYIINSKVHPAKMSAKELWDAARQFMGIRS